MVPDPQRGYRLIPSKECGPVIDEVMSRLGPHGRRYLEKRLVKEES